MTEFETKKRVNLPRIIGVGIAVIGLIVYLVFGNKIKDNATIKKMTSNKSNESSNGNSGDNDNSGIPRENIVKVGVVTWPGYAGGEYFNEGFKANTNSRFYKDYGFYVEFVKIDDVPQSRDAFKSGDLDVLWATIDALSTEADGLKKFKPKIILNADFSRGGDAMVVARGINKVADLRGKKIAVAPMTPSHTLLLNILKAGQLKQSEVEVIQVESAVQAAELFIKGEVDAAVVWSPDDDDCMSKVKGSKVLFSTAQATNIIADVFITKEEYAQNNDKKIAGLVEGWLKGNAEINSSSTAKKRAIEILSEGLGLPEKFFETGIEKVRLCTYGDNVNFFNLNGNFNGVTGEEIYNKMVIQYSQARSPVTNTAYIDGKVPSFRDMAMPKYISNLNLKGDEHLAEGVTKFTPPTKEMTTVEAVATVSATVSFPVNGYMLDDNAKRIIDLQFADIAKSFRDARIRIEGNTDNSGDNTQNKKLSKLRAQAVANYLIQEYNFDAHRFVITGNGSDKPVPNLDENSEAGRRANRRTDFEIINL